MKRAARCCLEFSRPFTLVAPALGFVSGAVTAYGAAPREAWHPDLIVYPADRRADGGRAERRVERAQPDLRPRDRSRQQAEAAADRRAGCRCATRGCSPCATYAVALVLAWLVAPGGRHECFWLVLVATVITILYSVPPARTKRLGIWANVTIAIPRGVLLKVAGWSSVKTIVGARAVVHRRHLRALPARRVDDQGLRRHGRGRARRLPHAADHLRRAPRGLDDLAVVRRPVPDDRDRSVDRRPHRQLPPAAGARRSA